VVFVLALFWFDARVLSEVSGTEGPYDGIWSVGVGALLLGGWLLVSAGVLGAVRARRRG
jgi:hypothetical protein